MNIPDNGQTRIVIVGAGFGGLTLAKKMVKKNFQIVIIDKNNFHQFQPLFYQVAMAGLEPSSILFPIRKIFQSHKNIYLRVGTATKINSKEKILETSIGSIKYDKLVLAMGADTNYFNNDNFKNNTLPLKSISESIQLRNAILEDYEKAITSKSYEDRQKYIDIVIVGGGPTGVEVAGALAEMKQYILPKDYMELDKKEVDIFLIQGGDQLLKGMSNHAAEKAEKFLIEMGVTVRKNTRVIDFDGRCVILKDGSKIPCGKVIWAAGIKANSIEGIPESSMAWANRLIVDNYNRVEGMEEIYAVGDICLMKTEAYPDGHPQVAQVAIQQAKNLSYNFIKGKKDKKHPLKSFKYKDLGSMATIGRNKAVVDLPWMKSAGFIAWLVWLLVHLFALIGVKNKLFVMINWMWSYITYDQSLRLIIKPDNSKTDKNKTT